MMYKHHERKAVQWGNERIRCEGRTEVSRVSDEQKWSEHRKNYYRYLSIKHNSFSGWLGFGPVKKTNHIVLAYLIVIKELKTLLYKGFKQKNRSWVANGGL